MNAFGIAYVCSVVISFYFTRSYFTLKYKRKFTYEDTADYVVAGVVCFIPAFNMISSIMDIVEEKEKHKLQESKVKQISMFELFMRNCFVHTSKKDKGDIR